MIGAVQINNETLEANVMPNAVFSAMKYREPPHNPDKNNKNSSFTQLAHNRRCAIVKIQKYASTKRYNNISTGDNPVLISIFVETNVVPPYNDCQYGDTMIQKIFTFKHNCVRIRFLFAAKLFKEDCFPIRQA